MILNYLRVSLRSFYKNAGYTSLNVFGLALGYAAFALILSYVHYERSFEDFHGKSDRLFRPTYHYQANSGFEVHWARIPADFINLLPEEFPEIEQLIRFQNQEPKYLKIGEERFRAKHTYITDPEVFEVFDFHLIEGDVQTALQDPFSIVLSEKMAKKYFGTAQVLGKTLSVSGHYQANEEIFTVKGVMKDHPSNTHLPVDMLFSFRNDSERRGWAYVYTLLKEGTNMASLKEKVDAFVHEQTSQNPNGTVRLVFQPFEDIHLHSNLAREIVPNGKAENVRIFFLVGCAILLIALFNYVNLSTAIGLGRSKEIGVRKILGSEKKQLVLYGFTESLLYHLLAISMGMLVVFFVFPYAEEYLELKRHLSFLALLGLMFLIAVLGGILSGLYPSILLSAFPPLRIASQNKTIHLGAKGGKFSFKHIMVLLQFCMSLALIASTFIAYQQIRFLHQKNLGLNKEQVLALTNLPNQVKDAYPEFRSRVVSIPGIRDVSACMEVPSREIRDTGPVLLEGVNSETSQAPMMDGQVIGPGFTRMMEMELLAGEDPFDKEVLGPPPVFDSLLTPNNYLAAQKRNYLINETAMKQLGWERPEDALGKQINWSIGGFVLDYGPVRGVVKDFHQESLSNAVDPVIMFYEPIWLNTFLLKVETGTLDKTLSQVETVWKDMFPNYPMGYQFLDELYHQLYQQERVSFRILTVFSMLAIFIAFMGLFALIAYALQTRMKEIALRTVLGANILDLTKLFGREYVWVLITAAVLAFPLSYYYVDEWLEQFAYHIEVGAGSYILSFCAIAGLLIGMIFLHVRLGNRKDPAVVLKEE